MHCEHHAVVWERYERCYALRSGALIFGLPAGSKLLSRPSFAIRVSSYIPAGSRSKVILSLRFVSVLRTRSLALLVWDFDKFFHLLSCCESVMDGSPTWGEYPHGEILSVHALR